MLLFFGLVLLKFMLLLFISLIFFLWAVFLLFFCKLPISLNFDPTKLIEISKPSPKYTLPFSKLLDQ